MNTQRPARIISLIASIALLPASGTALAQFGGFVDSGQNFGTGGNSFGLGDLDGDGDTDAFVTKRNDQHASNDGVNTVWLNDGSGVFVDSGQTLGTANSGQVALGDLDGDGDLDAFVANSINIFMGNQGQPDRVWLNDGNGNFTGNGQQLGSNSSFRVRLRDFDGDQDLDALVVDTAVATPHLVLWVNDGSGNFTEEQQIGNHDARSLDVGDLDDDGDIDAFVVSIGGSRSNKVWLNDGSGTLAATAQVLGNSASGGIGLGDVDSDGDLDAFVANYAQPERVWLNDGNGTFADSVQLLGNSGSSDVALGDLDFDGDLDAFVTNVSAPNKVWLNDGIGVFTDSGEALGNLGSIKVSLGDADGDGDLDAFVANGLLPTHPSKLWLNQSNPPPPTDTDGDGVPDDVDACPDSILSDTVMIGDCDSGVENVLFEDGCTLADLVQSCADGANNRGAFVRCVSMLAAGLKKGDVLTGKEQGALVSCAALSGVGN